MTWTREKLRLLLRGERSAARAYEADVERAVQRASFEYRLGAYAREMVRTSVVLCLWREDARKIRGIRQPSAFRAFLHRLAHDAARSVAGTRSSRFPASFSSEANFEAREPKRQADCGRTAYGVFLPDIVEQATRRLTALQSEIVRLRCLRQRSWAEIGRATGRSASAARMAWERALQRLRRHASCAGVGHDSVQPVHPPPA